MINVYNHLNQFIDKYNGSENLLETNNWESMTERTYVLFDTRHSLDEYYINTFEERIMFDVYETNSKDGMSIVIRIDRDTLHIGKYEINSQKVLDAFIPANLTEEAYFQRSIIEDFVGLDYNTYLKTINFFERVMKAHD